MLKRTQIHEDHKASGARFTEFSGWDMPVFYSSIIDEHNTVRTACGAFDTSHMGEFVVSGPNALKFLNSLIPSDISTLNDGQAKYSLLLNDNGGIIDDLIVYKRPSDYLVIVNAGNVEKDFEHFIKNIVCGVDLKNLSGDYCLFAVQGPKSEEVMRKVVSDDLEKIKYFYSIEPKYPDIKPDYSFLARTGYTGEDGFELLIPRELGAQVWRKILSAGAKPCGLGARDTLRLEACMPLHGHDIDEQTTPLTAGLGWTIGWDKDFKGKPALLKEKADGLKKHLIAFVMDSGIPRSNCDIIINSQKAGVVTSGSFSPTLKKGIGLGYADKVLKPGDAINILIHSQEKSAKVTAKPFYKRKKQ
jgi:aminomethyltransferase